MSTTDTTTLEEMMQAEIDALRAEVERLKKQLSEIGEICRPYTTRDED